MGTQRADQKEGKIRRKNVEKWFAREAAQIGIVSSTPTIVRVVIVVVVFSTIVLVAVAVVVLVVALVLVLDHGSFLLFYLRIFSEWNTHHLCLVEVDIYHSFHSCFLSHHLSSALP